MPGSPAITPGPRQRSSQHGVDSPLRRAIGVLWYSGVRFVEGQPEVEAGDVHSFAQIEPMGALAMECTVQPKVALCRTRLFDQPGKHHFAGAPRATAFSRYQ